MKKRLTALLLALSFAFSLVLAACSDNDGTATTPPSTSDEGDKEDVKNELVNASLSDIIAIFRDAATNGMGVGDLTESVRISGSVPENKLLGTPPVSLYMSGGIATLVSSDSTTYYALDGVRLLSLTDGSVTDVFAELGVDLDRGVSLDTIIEAISASEKFLSLAAVSEDDIIEGMDGYFYLSDSYLDDVISKIYTVLVLLSDGYLPGELETASAELTQELYEQGSDLARSLGVKIGFGLKMRRITSARICVDSQSLSEITDGALCEVDLNLDIALNTSRDRLSTLSLDLFADTARYGEISLELDFGATYTSTGAPLTITIGLDAFLENSVVFVKDASDGSEISVHGSQTLALDFAYNSRYSVSGGSLIDLSASRSVSSLSLQNGDGLKQSEKDELVDTKRYEKAISVSLKKNEKGEGIMPITLKDGPASASFTGSYSYGVDAEIYNVPDEVKTALGKKQ